MVLLLVVRCGRSFSVWVSELCIVLRLFSVAAGSELAYGCTE